MENSKPAEWETTAQALDLLVSFRLIFNSWHSYKTALFARHLRDIQRALMTTEPHADGLPGAGKQESIQTNMDALLSGSTSAMKAAHIAKYDAPLAKRYVLDAEEMLALLRQGLGGPSASVHSQVLGPKLERRLDKISKAQRWVQITQIRAWCESELKESPDRYRSLNELSRGAFSAQLNSIPFGTIRKRMSSVWAPEWRDSGLWKD